MMSQDLPERFRSRLHSKVDHPESTGDRTLAAVLIPLYLHDDTWHLLFTRRTDTLDAHRGQVAFPGGAIEEGDEDPVQAALREACEEIGLHPHDVEILGALDPLSTVTQFYVTPIVGVIPWPYDFRINREEVANVFGVPLPWLVDPGNLEIRPWNPSTGGSSIEVHFFQPFEEEVIWGATARITLRLLDLLDLRRKD
jgi:8-oxo-dGTP pyrophosphatase MutT (NUDIX family)